MLKQELNDQLTQVGPGTPMGELLRRYWYPVAFVRELDEWPIKKVRLLGENFALWKQPSGRYGIMQELCPHRRASMVYGVVEEEGLRCGYHGWLFDEGGQCLDQPAEPEGSTFADRVQAFAGRAEAMGGMVWAYVGPGPRARAAPLRRLRRQGLQGRRLDRAARATGCRSWRTRSTRTTWSGCTAGTSSSSASSRASSPRRGSRRSTSRSASTTWSGASSSAASSRATARRTTTGRSATRSSSPTACASAVPASSRCRSGCRSTTPTPGRLFYSSHQPPGMDSFPEQVYPVDYEFEWLDDERRAHRRLHRGPGHHGLGDPGRHQRPHRRAPRQVRHRRHPAAQDVPRADGAGRRGQGPHGRVHPRDSTTGSGCPARRTSSGSTTPSSPCRGSPVGPSRYSPAMDRSRSCTSRPPPLRGDSTWTRRPGRRAHRELRGRGGAAQASRGAGGPVSRGRRRTTASPARRARPPAPRFRRDPQWSNHVERRGAGRRPPAQWRPLVGPRPDRPRERRPAVLSGVRPRAGRCGLARRGVLAGRRPHLPHPLRRVRLERRHHEDRPDDRARGPA